jgi:hypothetical protein
MLVVAAKQIIGPQFGLNVLERDIVDHLAAQEGVFKVGQQLSGARRISISSLAPSTLSRLPAMNPASGLCTNDAPLSRAAQDTRPIISRMCHEPEATHCMHFIGLCRRVDERFAPPLLHALRAGPLLSIKARQLLIGRRQVTGPAFDPTASPAPSRQAERAGVQYQIPVNERSRRSWCTQVVAPGVCGSGGCEVTRRCARFSAYRVDVSELHGQIQRAGR